MPRRLIAAALTCALTVLQPAPAQQPLKPLNLDKVNTPKDEDDPHPSADRLRLYYASNAGGRFQILLAERKAVNQTWSAGKPLDSGPSGEGDDRSPFLTADGHDLYFAMRIPVRDPNKDAKEFPDNYDLVRSINLGKARQFTAPVPVQAVCTPEDEMFPWVTADGRELVFSRKTKDGWRLLVSSRPGKTGAFGEPQLVKELPAGFHHATLSRDGRTMVLQGPLEKGRWGLFRTTRANAASPWAEPVPLDALNSPDAPTGDTSPCLSADGGMLYFASDRPGGKGGRDLWAIDTALLKK